MDDTYETKESYSQKLTVRLKRSVPEIIGAVIGGIGGFIYYYKVGCVSGTCPITSNPWLSILWGTLMGYLLVGVFITKRK
ncbi:MAG TPA: hypothetical protein DIW31_12235 [Bacteroidales bacterium]|nr:hypothetical protein [Bacteroidales bacterium]